ncbi:MAG: hypothetical protein ABJA81_09640 [Nocardioidaceae bacterium]
MPRIEEDIFQVHHRQSFWSEVTRQMLDLENRSERLFWNSFDSTYVDAQLIGRRRLVDSDVRAITLRRLLGQLEQLRSQITFEWWVEHHAADESDIAHFRERFTNEYVDKPSDLRLGRVVISSLRDRLDDRFRRIVAFVNAHLAHRDLSAPPTTVTYSDLDEGVLELGDLFRWCACLLSASDYPTLTPEPLGDIVRPLRPS